MQAFYDFFPYKTFFLNYILVIINIINMIIPITRKICSAIYITISIPIFANVLKNFFIILPPNLLIILSDFCTIFFSDKNKLQPESLWYKSPPYTDKQSVSASLFRKKHERLFSSACRKHKMLTPVLFRTGFLRYSYRSQGKSAVRTQECPSRQCVQAAPHR